MTDIENRLRDELRAEAQRAQPHMLRELRVPRRRRATWAKPWMAPVAAVIAVAAVITGVRFATGDLHTLPAATGQAGMPPFYIVNQGTGPVVVRRSANGAVVARVSPPAGKHFAPVAAASDGRTFVLSAVRGTVLSFYRLHLAADGKPRPPTVLPFTVHQVIAQGKAGYIVSGIGLSPDGTELAVALVPGREGRQGTFTQTARARIEVASLTSGRLHTWTAPAKMIINDLSWENGGRKLAYLSSSQSAQNPPIIRMSILDTGRTGSDLAASSARVTLRTVTPVLAAVITPDGRDVIAWTGLSPESSAAVLCEFSLQTGQRLRVLYRGPGHGDFITYGFLTISADPSGRHLLISGMPVQGSTLLLGRVDNGRFTRLPGVNPSARVAVTAW
jgi:hypothetical protein